MPVYFSNKCLTAVQSRVHRASRGKKKIVRRVMSCKFRGQKYVRSRLNMDPIFHKFRRQLLNICTKLYVFFLTFLRHRDDDNTGTSQGNESDGEKVGSDDERAVN